MPPPSRKSTFYARCFLTGQRVGAVVYRSSTQCPEEDFAVNVPGDEQGEYVCVREDGRKNGLTHDGPAEDCPCLRRRRGGARILHRAALLLTIASFYTRCDLIFDSQSRWRCLRRAVRRAVVGRSWWTVLARRATLVRRVWPAAVRLPPVQETSPINFQAALGPPRRGHCKPPRPGVCRTGA